MLFQGGAEESEGERGRGGRGQIIARIHIAHKEIRELIHTLLTRVGRQHPQALIYPLLVACKSSSIARKRAAKNVLSSLKLHAPVLCKEAELVRAPLLLSPPFLFRFLSLASLSCMRTCT